MQDICGIDRAGQRALKDPGGGEACSAGLFSLCYLS